MPSFILLTHAERSRRRPQLDNEKFYDQIEQSSNWPDAYVSSSAHTQTYQDQGDVQHSNFVITVAPKKPKHVGDLPLAENLDDARSAEEYVQKAMHYYKQYGDESKRIPSSTYSKYNLIEEPVPIEVKEEQRYEPTTTSVRAYRYNKNVHHDYQDYQKIPTQTPKVIPPPQLPIYKDVYPTATSDLINENDKIKTQYHQDKPVKHHVIKIIENVAPSKKASLSESDKTEILNRIEESVLKMFKELERKQKREDQANKFRLKTPISVQYATTTTTTSSTKPPPHYEKDEYSDIPNVDLTIKNPKHRPRLIDLAALDVGQSWNHGTSFDHSAILKTAQGFDSTNAVNVNHQQTIHHQEPIQRNKPSKRKPHKLHFNQQTYHDINSLPFTAEKNNEYDKQYHKGESYTDINTGMDQQSLNNQEHSVSATISFGHQPKPEYNLQIVSPSPSPEVNPMHIINGIPVSNPYKIDINAIQYMLNGIAQAQAQPYEQRDKYNDEEVNAQSSNWEPHHKPKSILPHDSYSPKHNKNPPNFGYQENYNLHTPHITTPSPQSTSHSESASSNHKKNKIKKIKNDGSQYKWSQQLNNEDLYSPSASSTMSWSTGTDHNGSSTNTKIRVQRVPKAKRFHSKRSSSSATSSNKSSHSTWGTSDKSSSSTKKARDLETELRPPPRFIHF